MRNEQKKVSTLLRGLLKKVETPAAKAGVEVMLKESLRKEKSNDGKEN